MRYDICKTNAGFCGRVYKGDKLLYTTPIFKDINRANSLALLDLRWRRYRVIILGIVVSSLVILWL